MAGKKTFTKPINDLLQMARQSLDTLGNANQIVYGGVQKLADAELKALNDYYKAAVSSLKRARGEKDLKSTAQKQADLLQEAVSKLIGNARASLSVVADARDELAKLVKGNAAGAPLSAARLEKAMAPAVKALEKIKAEAKKAGEKAGLTVKTAKKDIKAEVAKVEKALKADVKAVKKDVKAKSKTIEKAVKTEVKAAKKVAKAVEKKVVKTAKVVEKKVEASVAEAKKAVTRAVPTPSPNSRASRATSAAKKVVTQVTETASAAVDAAKATVDNASAAVSAAVTTAVDAVKSQG
ncbi:phasin family protein [Nevskia sp.]|uniref:phasin family protein n=1 Tax=Nevskia sp. TaxID=1929292 RepID=UPI0025F01F53|nr:phasin family protein [Nevskia sp.]